MIQFNLLPDIKIQYLKARRQKHLVLLISIAAIIASLAVLVILISVVFVLQQKNISDLNKDIKFASNELKGTKDLNKMLAVQNQLKSLTGQHDAKPVATRIFNYITQSTPTAATISRLKVDYALHAVTLSGSADTLRTINIFTDTLKFAAYHTTKRPAEEKLAFSNVVLSTFAPNSGGATYTITFAFDPLIFSELEDVTLVVPQKVTTRSQTEQPAALFNEEATE